MKIKRLLAVVLMIGLGLFGGATKVQARIIGEKEGVVEIGEEEVIEDDLFIGAEEVLIEGVVEGDLYIGGGKVEVRGEVKGDVIAVGGMMEISGVVEDDVRVAGSDVSFKEAEIGDGVTVFGGSIDIDKETVVGGGLILAGGNVQIEAKVGRGIVGVGGVVDLQGEVGKDVHLGVGQLVIGDEAKVKGEVVYRSEEEIQVEDGAVVEGGITSKKMPVSEMGEKKMEVAEVFKKMAWGFKALGFLGSVLVGALMIRLLPEFSSKVVEKIEGNGLKVLGVGLLVMILAMPVLVILMVTGVGIWLALIMGAVLGIVMYLSKVFVGMWLGKWILKELDKKGGDYWSFVLGLLVFMLIKSVPVLGGIAGLAGLLLGVGAFYGLVWERLVVKK